MLGKLLKYDLKSELKSLLPMYLITFGLALVVRIMGMTVMDHKILSNIFAFLASVCVFALFGVILWTMITSVRHFYVNILKDEGYLTNTLPVTRNKLILSKEITSFITITLATIVVVACSMLAFYHGSIQALFETLCTRINEEGFDTIRFLIWVVVMLAVSYLSTLVMIHTSMMLGQMQNKNKVMYSVIFFIVIYTIMQFASLLVIAIDVIISPSTMAILEEGSMVLKEVYEYLILVFATSLILYAVAMVILHIINVYIANHRLNLE